MGVEEKGGDLLAGVEEKWLVWIPIIPVCRLIPVEG